MPTTYSLLLFGHVLLLVYWLGSDIGVFYGVRFVLDPRLSPETRSTVWTLVHWIDGFPRHCLVLMVPVGLSLAVTLGLIPLPENATAPALTAVWISGLGWLIVVNRIYNGARGLLSKVDLTVRGVVMIAFVAAGVASLAGLGPIEGADWLALKMILFAAIVGLGLVLRHHGIAFRIAYARMMAGQPTPELEGVMGTAMAKSKRVVLLLWAFVAGAAYLGMAKPF